MILHLLWSGDYMGGAQSFAIDLAKKVPGVTTGSVKRGSLKSYLEAENLPYVRRFFRDVMRAKIVIASDYRALSISLLLRILLVQRFVIVGVIHSNRLSKWDRVFRQIAKLLRRNDYLVVTTNKQKEYLSPFVTKTSVVLCRIHKQRQDTNQQLTQTGKNVMFFGRITHEKRVDLYLSSLREKSLSDRDFFVFGTQQKQTDLGVSEPCVYLHPGWHDLWETIERYKIGYVVIPNQNEGISLVTIEAIQLGVLPITRATSAFDTLHLPSDLHWGDSKPLVDVIVEIERSRNSIHSKCQSALRLYELTVPSFEKFITEIISGPSAK